MDSVVALSAPDHLLGAGRGVSGIIYADGVAWTAFGHYSFIRLRVDSVTIADCYMFHRVNESGKPVVALSADDGEPTVQRVNSGLSNGTIEPTKLGVSAFIAEQQRSMLANVVRTLRERCSDLRRRLAESPSLSGAEAESLLVHIEEAIKHCESRGGDLDFGTDSGMPGGPASVWAEGAALLQRSWDLALTFVESSSERRREQSRQRVERLVAEGAILVAVCALVPSTVALLPAATGSTRFVSVTLFLLTLIVVFAVRVVVPPSEDADVKAH